MNHDSTRSCRPLATMSRLLPLGLVLFLLLVPMPRTVQAQSDEKSRENQFSFLACDGFDGKLSLHWQPVRHDPTHVSLLKNPGKLTITTQRGTIHRAEKESPLAEGFQAKNIFVIDNPLSPEIDFVMTTCVTGFTPEARYQQAGLIVYGDDDNYLKWGYEFNWPKGSGQAFCILSETEARSQMEYVAAEQGLKRYWLRLTKRANRYEYASSTDGVNFTVHGEREWANGAPKKLGLLAKNGGLKDVSELDAAFDFFELRAPVPASNSVARRDADAAAYVIAAPDILRIDVSGLRKKAPPIRGEHLVRPDGTVSLGAHGSVAVARLTLDQARAAVVKHLEAQAKKKRKKKLEAAVEIAGYNSKVYYVVSAGELHRVQYTGAVTVADAIRQVKGAAKLAATSSVWIARPAAADRPVQNLPVDWDDIVRDAGTATNYQILPGDRVFVGVSPPK